MSKKETEKTTNKGLKADYTRHTIAIKKEHLHLLKALAIYSHDSLTNVIADVVDKAIENIDKKTITKALTLYNDINKEKPTIFKK